jgi:UDP-3-O-[3-hydroxymyristoyl] glucosamine N-acyltransferase
MGGQGGVNGHITVGNGVVIGGKALVMGDVPDNTMISGYPARPHKENLKSQALISKLPEFYESLKEIKKKLNERQGS